MSQPIDSEFVTGKLLLVDKPADWTSFDVVNKIRYTLCKALNIKKLKVGHAGTLDPMATGLLLICTGRATKTINDFVGLEKEYTGTIRLGGRTPSYDAESEVEETFPIGYLTPEAIQAATLPFIGTTEQIPPAFSAKRYGGKRAYEMARSGKEVKLAPCPVTISAFELTRIELPEVDFRIVCSKGTYIRSIAHDLGKSLNNGGYLTKLCRTRIGGHALSDALSMEEIATLIAEKAIA